MYALYCRLIEKIIMSFCGIRKKGYPFCYPTISKQLELMTPVVFFHIHSTSQIGGFHVSNPSLSTPTAKGCNLLNLGKSLGIASFLCTPQVFDSLLLAFPSFSFLVSFSRFVILLFFS